jgi:hypothetical protein
MVSVLTLHYEFSLGIGRLDTDFDEDISSTDVDALLNNSKDLLQNRYSELVEKNSSVEDVLKDLEVVDTLLSVSKLGREYTSYKLPANYYKKVNLKGYGCCINCQCDEDQKINMYYVQRSDLDTSLLNHWKPSWNWRRALYNFSSSGIDVYHDTINLKSLYLSYIKYIPDVAAPSKTPNGSYLASDGITTYTEDKHLMLPKESILWRKIVQLAVYMYKKNTNNPTNAEINDILFSETIGVQ